MSKEGQIQFVLLELVSIVNILFAFGRDIGSNGLNLDSLKVLGVEVVFFSEVSEVVVIGYHKGEDLCESDIEARVMIDLRCQVFQVRFDLVGVQEVDRMVKTTEPF